MNRRQFVAGAVLATQGLPALAAEQPATKSSAKRALMKVGDQTEPSTQSHFQYLARYGVGNVCAYPEINGDRLYATVEELKRLVDLAGKSNIQVDCTAPPFLESSYIDKEKHPAIMLAQSPQRDRDIESLQTMIRNCAQAGIPAIKYNMSILGVVRSERTPGRGDATYSTWKLSEAHPPTPLTRAGLVSEDQFWERITYFLEHVIPVANEYKVRLACHPHDPGMPPEGYQGVHRVLGTVDGLKRFISIHESPYHGLNFCQGTVSEMLENPGQEIFDVIRYFGSRNKIFNVHFRNIRGHRNNFQEVYPDEGDINFVKAIQVYREVGYAGMLMPDHVPQAASDPAGLQSFAYCYGYIRALIQASDYAAS